MSSSDRCGRLLLAFSLAWLLALYLEFPRHVQAQTGPANAHSMAKTTGGGTGGVPPMERAKPNKP
jgi:hypothetical protein